MPTDVSDDNHIEKFVFAAVVGGFGAYAEDLLWRKINDVEKTQQDLEALSREFNASDMAKILSEISESEKEIEKQLKEIEEKKEYIKKLKDKQQNLDYEKYELILVSNLNKMGTINIDNFNDQGTISSETSRFSEAIEKSIRKQNEEKHVRNYFKKNNDMGDLLHLLDTKIENHEAYTFADLQELLEQMVQRMRFPDRDTIRFKTCDPPLSRMSKPEATFAAYTDGNCFPRVHRVEYILDPSTVYTYDYVASIRNLEKDGDPTSYVLEKNEMHETVLNILEKKEHQLINDYNSFQLDEISSGCEEFFQIVTLYNKIQENGGPLIRNDISACSRALLKSLSILAKLDREKYDTTSSDDTASIFTNINAVMNSTAQCEKIDDIFAYEVGDIFQNYIELALSRSK